MKFIKNNFYLKIINKIDSKIIEIKLVLFFKLKDKKQKKLGYKKMIDEFFNGNEFFEPNLLFMVLKRATCKCFPLVSYCEIIFERKKESHYNM